MLLGLHYGVVCCYSRGGGRQRLLNMDMFQIYIVPVGKGMGMNSLDLSWALFSLNLHLYGCYQLIWLLA